MSNKTITQAVTKVVEELSDFSPEERRRIVQASLTLLGDGPTALVEPSDQSSGGDSFPAKTRMWIKQHGLSAEQISHIFHPGEDGMQIIAPIPGTSRRVQVRNAYVLSGIAQLLAHGETKFDDKSARDVCESGGFFDTTNHAKYLKCSEFTGSREKGWVLTAPGMNLGASLIKQLSQP